MTPAAGLTARILRIELRRSAARWAALMSVPLVLFLYGEVGRGLNLIAADHRQMLALFIPLALGLGAGQARRERRSRMEELIAATARPGWRRRGPTAAALAIGAVAGCWAAFAALAGYTAVAGGYLAVASLPLVAVTGLYLVAAVWFGLAIGRLLPWRLTPPLLVVIGFVALVWMEFLGEAGNRASGWTLLLPTMAGNAGEFTAFIARAHVIQALWVVALVATGLIAYSAGRRARLAAVVPAVLGLVVLLPLTPRHFGEIQTLDRGATSLVCTSDAPRVCVTRAHRLALPGLREPGREALAILSAKLPPAPTSVVELYYGVNSGGSPQPRRADTVYAEVSTDNTGRTTGEARDTLWSLLMGAGTRPCDNAFRLPPQQRVRYDTARLVAAAWLLGEEPLQPSYRPEIWGGLPDRSVTMPPYQALRALPADEQRSRVAALRAAELACDGRDRLQLLAGPG